MENNKKLLNPGVTFLEEHHGLQKQLNLKGNHIIVDREDWEKVIGFFRNYPDQFDKMIGNSRVVGKFPEGDNEMETKI